LVNELVELFNKIKPQKLIEIGTGKSTIIIQEILKKIPDVDRVFYTVEINPEKYNESVKYFSLQDYKNLYPLCGLSIPRELLKDKFIFSEYECLDNVLEMIMRNFKGKPDFVLLDGDIRTADLEFNYLLSLLKQDCYIMFNIGTYDFFEVEKFSEVTFINNKWILSKYNY
jgi:predicted O-methyltransferase YrrM